MITVRRLLRRLHEDQSGTVSLETALIPGAIGIPVLIVIIKFRWPKIKEFFDRGMTDLRNQSDRAIDGQ